MERKTIYTLINDERAYQERQLESGRWERMSESPMEFLADIRVYARKCEEDFVNTGKDKKAMKRILQIAALCVAAMEKNGAPIMYVR